VRIWSNLKKQLSYLSAPSKSHPLNNDTLIIYFVGGLTCQEFKIVKEVFLKEEFKQNVSVFLFNKKAIFNKVLNSFLFLDFDRKLTLL